ncbi:hypothetical protein Kpol_1036p9 [Vanderwaltozyma polyspora DSM 70294]|uniref:Uncharacterized protein n=1 Tax=Vanderwaltozyma polyspora (strain ATCC 22028 / DSM 70294 / BCRC 21397 / CBS 2163 / NBRC 10782 / NRRL Y-8283 / UCD 57-17) TaxID=436907 RepID=A7TEG0_VANPO|nr:uncharacterized protein Kpol_1036p9 [Vanderwaltozyma polyspora DSM 70294]EDO19267.1 hypothetical protein Kpol_1036p9 [Vanderwaltozyma polyspora DSM 70294]
MRRSKTMVGIVGNGNGDDEGNAGGRFGLQRLNKRATTTSGVISIGSVEVQMTKLELEEPSVSYTLVEEEQEGDHDENAISGESYFPISEEGSKEESLEPQECIELSDYTESPPNPEPGQERACSSSPFYSSPSSSIPDETEEQNKTMHSEDQHEDYTQVHKSLKELIDKTNRSLYNVDSRIVTYKAGLSKKCSLLPSLHPNRRQILGKREL